MDLNFRINSVVLRSLPEVKKYPAPGRCIYCNKAYDQASFGDEHIIPFALGGTSVIEGGSCGKCGGKTSAIEGFIARNQFLPARIMYGLKPRKKRQFEVPILKLRLDGKLVEKTVEASDHHLAWGMMYLPPPSILLQKESLPKERGCKWVIIHRQIKREIAPDAKRVRIRFEYWTGARRNLQFLAKVGHCIAVASFGLDAFEPLLPSVVLGNPKLPNSLIGCIPGHHKANKSGGPLHTVSSAVVRVGGIRYATVILRLFSTAGNPGTPIYVITAGPLRDQAQEFPQFGFTREGFDDMAKKFLSVSI